MKLIKLSEEHYIGVDESEIKEGDFVYSSDGGIFKRHIDNPCQTIFPISKITHSTQPIENLNGALGWKDIDILLLSEVKELLAWEIHFIKENEFICYEAFHISQILIKNKKGEIDYLIIKNFDFETKVMRVK